jgi:predicted DNA-binding transcriptional regulator YafY
MMSETLMRQWQMLRLVPRSPSKMASMEIKQRLADEGFNVTPRTIQRDLMTFSAIFPLRCDDREKPYGWSWMSDADVMDIPGMDSHTALAFYLAKEHLEPLLPVGTVRHLKPHFDSARHVLDAIKTDSGAPAWKDKVRVLHRGPKLTPPAIITDVHEEVYEALLLNRQLNLSYKSRAYDKPREYNINPLGLVLKDGLFYLVCTFGDYEDIRLLTLHRMEAARKLDIPCKIPEGFNLDAYISSGELDFAVGGDIKLKAIINKQVAFHLEERPLNADQKLTDAGDEYWTLEVTVQDTNELRWWLMGFGENVEVLEPVELREEFRRIAGEMASNYEE